MLNAEMDMHRGGGSEQEAGNHRNGSSRKTVLSDDGEWHQVGFFEWDDEGDPDRDSWRAAIAEIVDAHRGRDPVIVWVQYHG